MKVDEIVAKTQRAVSSSQQRIAGSKATKEITRKKIEAIRQRQKNSTVDFQPSH